MQSKDRQQTGLKNRVLISVYDKAGIVEFATELVNLGFEIVSTGGTYKLLNENKIKVYSVEEVTGFPEILGGRVKTLHPKIFGGILADKSNPEHSKEISDNNLESFEIVVVNLYPFEETISKPGISLTEAIEQIDIGGVSLIRAAAKNFNSVNVLVNPGQYKEFTDNYKLHRGNIPESYSRMLAAKAFELTSQYDKAIGRYLSSFIREADFALIDFSKYEKIEPFELRYGENPHQKGYLLKDNFEEIFKVLHGKNISYNNLLDIDAAFSLISEFRNDKPACAIIKHGNPCGVAVADDLDDAYNRAFETDTLSPFGGILIFNKKLDFKTSSNIDKLFTEIILAPDFDEEALELLKKKKNRRLLKFRFADEKIEFRKISGGVLLQQKDLKEISKEDLNFPTKRKADENEIEDMLFAFKIAKHTKSNAVVFAKGKKTLAIGGGQPSRIDSTKIAIAKAKEFGLDLKESSAASDAFFPFADGLLAISAAGASSVIQPGGSVRDEEIIKAADDNDIAMAFTGVRHFKH